MSKPEIVGYLNFGALTGEPVVSADCWSELASEPLIRLTDYERLQAARAADKARIAELTSMLLETTAVAITMLYDSHKEDVTVEFSIDELKQVVASTEHLQAEAVERIYRRAWDAALAQQGKEGQT